MNSSSCALAFLLACSVPLATMYGQDRESEIRNLLTLNGIAVNKLSPCTQVGGLLKSSVLELIAFKHIYGRPLTVTAGNESGTEIGPECTGKYPHKADLAGRNHLTGWKVDLQVTPPQQNLWGDSGSGSRPKL
jgi:hypothetical protein